MTDFDPVNKPRHYNIHPSGVECIELTERMGFLCGNAWKYMHRALHKSNPRQDYEKALWYMAREHRFPVYGPLGSRGPCCLHLDGLLTTKIAKYAPYYVAGQGDLMRYMISGDLKHLRNAIKATQEALEKIQEDSGQNHEA